MAPIIAEERHVNLLAEGWLPGWASVVVFVLAAGFVLWMWRRERASLRPTVVTRWILPIIRVLIVALAVWLLCRPVLRIVDVRHQRPTVLVAIDRAASMSTVEGFGSPHRKLDAIEATQGRLIIGRDRAATTLAAVCRAVTARLEQASGALSRELQLFDQGLPLAPLAITVANELAIALPAQHDALADLVTLDRLQPTESPTLAQLASVSARRRAIQAQLPLIAQEAALAAKSSDKQVELLRGLMIRIHETAATSAALAADADLLQGSLDRAMIAPAEWSSLRDHRASRHDFAQAAFLRLRERLGASADLVPIEARGVEPLLEALFSERIGRHAIAAVLVSDGASPAERSPELARKLAVTGLPVHAILAAADGVEPDDLAVAAVEAPMVAVRGAPAKIRVLTKNTLATTRPATIVIRTGSTILARQPLLESDHGYRALEMPVSLPQAGRWQLIIEARADAADSFPGNERQVVTIDVLEERARILVVADRATENLAAYAEVLRDMPHVRATIMAAVGPTGRLRLGSEDGFPIKPEEWKGTTLAVLIGAVPRELMGKSASAADAESMRALRIAMQDGGLRVLLHPEPGPPPLSWTEALGVRSAAIADGARALPREDMWSETFRLAVDVPASMERWRQLAPLRAAFSMDGLHWPLVMSDRRVMVGVARRNRGAIVFNGLGDLSALRGDGHSGDVNRVVRSLLDLAIAQSGPSVSDHSAIFPPQPVAGRGIYVLTGATGAASTTRPDAATMTGDWVVVGHDASARFGAAEFAVQPDLALADLNLMPRAAPLRAIADVTHGRFVTIDRLSDLPLSASQMAPVAVRFTSVHVLWRGWWPLVVLLLLVSSEYLLRRRAGRVM